MRISPKTATIIVLVAAMAATILVYLPGLSGGYVFDDFPNIVDNAAIHVTHSTLANWANAAWASPASELQRPLASLTFALNWYFSGGYPWPMKAVNLAIHLLNGLLLYGMLGALLQTFVFGRSDGRLQASSYNSNANDDNDIDAIAVRRLILAVTAGWLLLPINLMAVLYVVQREESLCQVFVLAGLWMYLAGRRRMLQAAGHHGFAIAATGLILGTALGVLSKESAVLLPVYAFLIELTLLRFASARALRDRRLLSLYSLVLLLPAALGLAWLLPHVLSASAWDNRDFTLGQRLLTEPRVLVDYLRWTVLPDPATLSLYHDQLPISRGLLTPWTTLPAILLLTVLLGIAWWLRDRRPLIALGILWFFAGQLLTATIVPLELVYEHRNYFASIGVLLALFSLLLGLRKTIALPIVRITIVALVLVWFGGVTFLRAQDWSSPLRLAIAEANRHPDSPRANYEAGRLLIIASEYQPSLALERAKFYLNRAASIAGASSLPEQAQIMIANHGGDPDDPALWKAMIAKLRAQPTAQEDISALISLTQCERKGDCRFDPLLLQRAYLAALSHPNPIARLLGAYADFASQSQHDDGAAIRYLRMAVDKAPSEPAYRVQLTHLLAIHGMTEEAVRNIDALRRMDTFGRLDAQIAILEQQAERGGPSLKP